MYYLKIFYKLKNNFLINLTQILSFELKFLNFFILNNYIYILSQTYINHIFHITYIILKSTKTLKHTLDKTPWA